MGGIWDESWKSFPITRNDGTNLEILLIFPSSIRRLEWLEYFSARVKLEIHQLIDENYVKIKLIVPYLFIYFFWLPNRINPKYVAHQVIANRVKFSWANLTNLGNEFFSCVIISKKFKFKYLYNLRIKINLILKCWYVKAVQIGFKFI